MQIIMKTSDKACAVRAKCDLESPRGVCMIRQCSERLRDMERGGQDYVIPAQFFCKASFVAPVKTIDNLHRPCMCN